MADKFYVDFNQNLFHGKDVNFRKEFNSQAVFFPAYTQTLYAGNFMKPTSCQEIYFKIHVF